MQIITLQPGESVTITAAIEVPPIPPAKRLYFSYFGGMEDEIFQFENMVFATTWGNPNTEWIVGALQRAKNAGVEAAIVAMDYLLYTPGLPRRYIGKSAADANCRAFFDALRAGGVLDMVKCLYPIDEPERDANVPATQIVECNVNLRAVASAYPDLIGVKLGVIYGDGRNYRGLASYDWIGIDAYQYGAGILTQLYPGLISQMTPGQQLILVPGGASPWMTRIDPFYEYAKTSPRTALICPFIYQDNWGYTGNLGIQGNGLAPSYNDVAAQIRSGQ